ncbi:hypothetical protein C4J83_4402 [Pseudomonas sp. LBUM920]|nr:hypothetical protein C4J83_4402 [Pseudomonas sp. LBUM920]
MHGRSSKSVRQKILVPSYQTLSRSIPSSGHQTGNALFHCAAAAHQPITTIPAFMTAKFATTSGIWRHFRINPMLTVGAGLPAMQTPRCISQITGMPSQASQLPQPR